METRGAPGQSSREELTAVVSGSLSFFKDQEPECRMLRGHSQSGSGLLPWFPRSPALAFCTAGMPHVGCPKHTPSPPSLAQDPYRDRGGAIPMSPQSGPSPSQEHFVPGPHMGKARPTAHGSPTPRKLASECGEIYFHYSARQRAVCRF